MSEANSLIYQNAHSYRIHADNLRWTLLVGYATLLGASLSLAEPELLKSTIASALFVAISINYLMVLAVQNWFYNLFARYADDCESKMIAGSPLRSLQAFAIDQGKYITPFHPAFSFAILIVPLGMSIAIFNALRNYLSLNAASISALMAFLAIVAIIHLVFKNWNSIVYEKLIVPLSNLYKQPKDKPSLDA